MGQKNQLFVTVNANERLAAIGVDAGAAEAFRAVAAARAPELARAYAALFSAAYTAEGLSALPPRWRAAWPAAWREPISWKRTKALAVAGLRRVHPALGRNAEAVVGLGRALISTRVAPHTRASRFGPPWVTTRFDGASEAPLVLAHELGHAAQMAQHRYGPSQPPPLLAPSELAAHVAERGFHAVYADAGHPRAAAARVAEDLLVMLVRHPARDALENAEVGGGETWGQISARYAPGHAWSADAPPLTTRAIAEPLSTLGYAMAATLATALFARIDQDAMFANAYLKWMRAGPDARFEDAAALLGLRADDPALYEAAYDAAMDDMRRCLSVV